MPADTASAVLAFWFDDVGRDRWFAKSAALDSEIRRRFAGLRDALVASEAEGWRSTAPELLAAIIVLDQFSRNIHRGVADAFAADPLALDLACLGLARGWDADLSRDQRQFLLMPLMHSEALAVQQRALIEFERLGDPEVLAFARAHHDQIARFGRFPGRNAALGRHSTPGELDAIARGAGF